MEKTTGKCSNHDCSQFGMEKSVLVVTRYGYGQGENSVVCPECENPLLVNLGHRTIRQRVVFILDNLTA